MTSVVVVGAGQMGQGIAQVAAQSGCAVTLIDADLALAQRGKDLIAKGLKRQVERGKLSDADAQATLDRIALMAGIPTALPGDIAIEAVVEDTKVKCDVFSQLSKAMPSTAVLASNTSSVSITALAAATSRPEQVIGMHFMNPVPAMKLVEVIRGLQTNDATHASTTALAQHMGKAVVTVQEAPGFVVNRILIPMLNEAVSVLEAGLASREDIDAAMTLGTNQPMGPLALADLIGLDTVLAICEVLHGELGDDKYRPAPLLRRYVAAGWLGKKRGRGFYTYG